MISCQPVTQPSSLATRVERTSTAVVSSQASGLTLDRQTRMMAVKVVIQVWRILIETAADFPGERESALLQKGGAFAHIGERRLALVVDARVPTKALFQLGQRGTIRGR